MRSAQPIGVIGRFVAALVPSLTAVVFVLVGVVPAAVPGLSTVSPLLSVAVIFFWVVTRPALMPPAAVFFVGLLQDVLSGGPIGLWALTLLVVQYLSLSQRQYLFGKTFTLGWVGFASIVSGAALLAWLGACIYYGVFLSPAPVLVQGALTMLVYPAIAWILVGLSRWMPPAQ
ncbi:MAG: rod shape-determining protein MreD [Alphaproteobacteria bacterium]|nr:rod shape-determining protein MreD [Alphaproteobacteria bacterium]